MGKGPTCPNPLEIRMGEFLGFFLQFEMAVEKIVPMSADLTLMLAPASGFAVTSLHHDVRPGRFRGPGPRRWAGAPSRVDLRSR